MGYLANEIRNTAQTFNKILIENSDAVIGIGLLAQSIALSSPISVAAGLLGSLGFELLSSNCDHGIEFKEFNDEAKSSAVGALKNREAPELISYIGIFCLEVSQRINKNNIYLYINWLQKIEQDLGEETSKDLFLSIYTTILSVQEEIMKTMYEKIFNDLNLCRCIAPQKITNFFELIDTMTSPQGFNAKLEVQEIKNIILKYNSLQRTPGCAQNIKSYVEKSKIKDKIQRLFEVHYES